MAASINFELLISGYLRKARAQASPRVYLQGLHDTALAAVTAGDEFVTSTSGEDGAATAERGVPATSLLQIMESCLQTLDAEDGASADGFTGALAGNVRYADFSSHPCTLG